MAAARSPPRHHIERTCLGVAVRLAEGELTAEQLAGRLGTASQLVHDGLPRLTDDPVSQDAFNRLWRRGIPLDEIRAALTIGPKVAKAHAAAAPPRWTGKDIRAFLGWSPANHRLRLARGHFPIPDGRDGTKEWWWPATITDWAATQPFVRCSHCGALVARLRQHLTKHAREVEQTG